jgi:hypothetical protein
MSDLISRYESARRLSCERREFAGWQTDVRCVAERRKKATALLETIHARHAAELAAAPDCLRAFSVPADVLRKEGINQDSPNAIADLLSRGFILSAVMEFPECRSQVCRWRQDTDPERAGAFCP